MKYGMIPSPLDPITDWFYKNREVIVIMVGGTIVLASFIWLAENVVPKLHMSSGDTGRPRTFADSKMRTTMFEFLERERGIHGKMKFMLELRSKRALSGGAKDGTLYIRRYGVGNRTE